jgi:hypothetical protein
VIETMLCDPDSSDQPLLEVLICSFFLVLSLSPSFSRTHTCSFSLSLSPFCFFLFFYSLFISLSFRLTFLTLMLQIIGRLHELGDGVEGCVPTTVPAYHLTR